jgi:hypothetical protein
MIVINDRESITTYSQRQMSITTVGIPTGHQTRALQDTNLQIVTVASASSDHHI